MHDGRTRSSSPDFTFPLEVPSDWSLCRLDDQVTLKNGSAFNAEDWKLSGHPIIRIQNLKDRDALFNYFQGNPESKVPIYPGDLLFSWSGSQGTSFGPHVWHGPLGVLNQHIFKVVLKPDAIVTQDFLYYALKFLTTLIEKQAYGLVVQHSGCDGYNRLSLRRALAIVKRQLPVAWTALRWVAQAVVVRRTRSWVGSRWSRPCLDTTAHSSSAILSPLPCLGV
jgi:type I restriction modification DNA specificity protein